MVGYFSKHLKRNKKWLEDLRHLKSGVLKSITYEDLCCMEYKLRMSIFNHCAMIEEVILPLKRECMEAREALQEIMPYCKEIECNIMMRENVYSPQSRLYKWVKGLLIKDYPLRMYERDCETVKGLMGLQSKLEKRGNEGNIRALVDEFQTVYKEISPYLHEVASVWDLILGIVQRMA
jgi:hypothetical protein